jgi:hypothetical protein
MILVTMIVMASFHESGWMGPSLEQDLGGQSSQLSRQL